MDNHLNHVQEILDRSKDALNQFMEILIPAIEEAKDEHERLYWHHIYEEEEHRLDRLDALLPKIHTQIENSSSLSKENGDFLRLLQDISLEKFGLHNFLEHLDLSLFHYKDTDYQETIEQLRNMTASDYQTFKHTFDELNNELDAPVHLAASIPTDEKENKSSNLKIDTYTQESQTVTQQPTFPKSSLTVGNLKGM
ncbi:IMEF encapsulin system ferritin-like cargo protein [Bacillus sp. FJAT-47783]|uniref:IMEF encapsulin system ferritin-like cargo protein n=1 Tax=Bacillus sp. FJAT-47783 TaxID=2922712 RepID=UPI001FAE3D50|nr:IMEF encapsulin system ferritin-like cargo protein [Bacillus sp. FJAT-47783]